MKNKTALIAAIAILLIVIGGGIFLAKSFSKPAETIDDEEQISNLPPVDPSVKVVVNAKPDGKAVVLSVSSIPFGTESIEYEFSYNTGEGLPKGALGKIDVNGKSEVTKEILLGTCSKNTCTYDTGVTAADLVLKFNHPDGATQFTNQFSL